MSDEIDNERFTCMYLLYRSSNMHVTVIVKCTVTISCMYLPFLRQFTGDSPPPPQLQVLPLAILDDLMEAVTFFASLPVGFDSRGVTNVVASALGESTTLMDVELVAAVTLFIMRSSVLIKNPHTRWSRYLKQCK